MAETAADATGAFREGDWYCERCGDHQFERNLMCRKCAAPKPMVSTNNQASKAGDWICPNPQCMDLQFERNMVCRKCGSGRPAGTLQKAGADGQGELGGSSGGETAARPMGNSSAVFAPDDWMCPACGDHQFARNQQCRNCGSPKPAGAGKGGAGAGGCAGGFANYGSFGAACGGGGGRGAYMGGAPVSQFAVGPQGASYAPAAGGKGAGGASFAPGDWMCTQCGDHQFSRNTACRKCGAAKPMTSSNNQPMKAGDWICPNPDCKDLQFAKNDACRKCGMGRPGEEGDASSRARSRSPRR
uniref:RanBP2-type domain-containing protein n=1 Tax=Alexandrium catenella TaxID=2925 RepID=A0A7S1R4V9_ALECA|mmetsp:Transcript_4482/g.11991  ORF Transcript_4482/g.11991 Transcript_4482/m.11991 type:complete len:300 (+) Transcript_4482:52-951(+)